MKTLKHKLLSIPNKEIDISEEYAQIAYNLIKDLGNLQYPEDVIGALYKYGYAFDNQINTQAHAFFDSKRESPENKKITDKLHILIGMKGVDEDTRVGSVELKKKYERINKEFHRKNNSVYDKLAWHLGNLE